MQKNGTGDEWELIAVRVTISLSLSSLYLDRKITGGIHKF